MYNFLWVLVAATVAQAAVLRNGVEIPWYAPVCSRSDPNLDACLKTSIQQLLRAVSKDGIRQVGVAPLDPWHTEELDLTLAREQNLKVGIKFQDTICYGLSKLEVLDVRTNFEHPENMTLEFDFFNKKVFVEGKYQAEGLLAALPIVAKGEFNMSIGDVKGMFKMSGHIVTKDGVEHLAIDRAFMSPDVGTFEFGMTNDKYPELTNVLVALMNANWKVIYIGLQDFAEDTFDKIIRPRMNLAFLKIPFNQIIWD